MLVVRGLRLGPPSKRPRVSTDSTGSATGASKFHSVSQTLDIEQFKSLNVDDKLDRIFVCLQGIMSTNERLLKAEQTVHELRNIAQTNKTRIDLLAYKSIDNEARQRRNNLIFWGIPETLNEDCMTVISEFLSDKLAIDPDAIYIQRAHRIGRINTRRHGSSQSAPTKHRPLIAAFRDYPDVELIISNAGKLKGTTFGINRDYPQEIVDARKPLFREKKQLKSLNPSSNISIQYPAKLVKDGLVVKDMLPDWFRVMKGNRISSEGYIRTESNGVAEQLLDNSYASVSGESDMEVGDGIHRSAQRAASSIRVVKPGASLFQRSPAPNQGLSRNTADRADDQAVNLGNDPNATESGRSESATV